MQNEFWNTENLTELKDKESFVVEPGVNPRKALVDACLGLELPILIISHCFRWK